MAMTQLQFLESDFVMDLKQNLDQLKEKITPRNPNGKLSVEERCELKSKLIDLMQFYAEAKELSVYFF